MARILISEEVQDPAVDDLACRHSLVCGFDMWRDRTALLDAVAGAEALLVRNQTLVDRDLLAAAPRLKVVGRIGVGMDNLDLRALSDQGVVVCYPPEENAVSVAEHVFALLLCHTRRICAAAASVRAGSWQRSDFIGDEISGRTMGVLGLGRIGFRVAVRARAFGMRVLAYDPYLSAQHPAVTETGAELVSLKALLEGSDVISCHLPLTDDSRGLLNEEALALIRPGAVLINTARGAILDEAAVERALQSGKLSAALLDVREAEPPPPGGLSGRTDVLQTPHIASWTHESLRRVVATVVEDVERVLSGLPARNFINFPEPGVGER